MDKRTNEGISLLVTESITESLMAPHLNQATLNPSFQFHLASNCREKEPCKTPSPSIPPDLIKPYLQCSQKMQPVSCLVRALPMKKQREKYAPRTDCVLDSMLEANEVFQHMLGKETIFFQQNDGTNHFWDAAVNTRTHSTSRFEGCKVKRSRKGYTKRETCEAQSRPSYLPLCWSSC